MSVSSVSLSSDANVRYQRLAQEYTKLRAQAKVLREGVLEERTKIDKLQEELKSKEAVIRRLEGENEALTFRNDQLARRVETLQLNPKATPPAPISTSSELLEAELKRKLVENEKLHSQIAENERQHAIEMAEMSEKLAREMRKLEEDVRQMRQKSRIVEKVISDKENEMADKERENGTVEVIGSPEPPESMEEVKLMVAETIRNNFSSLHNVFNLLQQRTEIYPFDVTMERLPPHVQKLSSEYAQISRLFSELTTQMDQYLQNYPETSSTDSEVRATIISMLLQVSTHLHQMLPDLVRQMTSEESRVTWCTAQLAKINNQWEETILKTFVSLETIAESLKTGKSIEEIHKNLEEIQKLSVATSTCFRERWKLESRLPTTTRRMRCVGVALEESLAHWTLEAEKLEARIGRMVIMIRNTVEKPEIRRETPKVEEPPVPEADISWNSVITKSEVSLIVQNQSQNENEVSTNPFDDDEESEHCDTPEPTKFSESDARKFAEFTRTDQNQKLLPVEENKENNPNDYEISHLVTRNEQLQKDRDRLLVEFSLVKRKYEIATGEKFQLNPETPEMDQIWDCGMERRDEWIRKVYEAEKAVRFYQTEFDLLLRHEVASEEEISHLKSELFKLESLNQKLEDELESVRRSYEGQLGDLSEHLASLVKEKEKDKEASKSRGSLKSFFNKSSS